jgi:membrane protein YqaA with SNARE-associated domain
VAEEGDPPSGGGRWAWVRRRWYLVVAVLGIAAFAAAYALVPPFRVGLDGGLGWALGNPWVFFPLLFVYAILIAVILPIPVELILINPAILNDSAFFLGTALTIGAGKAVGSWLIFYLGVNLEEQIRGWSRRLRLVDAIVRGCEWVVKKTRYVGLFLLLSVPLMSDTAVLYVFALFNPPAKSGADGRPIHVRHTLKMTPFVLTNFFGGIARVALFVFILRTFDVCLGCSP